jgi:hypothetical protein
MKINLFNRDGADLWLEKIKKISEHEFEWKLYVDQKHLYCLQYIRCIGDYPDNLEAVDPSGGPMINLGDKFENGKYKIIKIINPTTFILWEQ